MITDGLPALVVAGLLVLLLRIALYDLRYRRIRNIDNGALAILGLIYVWSTHESFVSSLAGLILGGLFLAGLAEYYRARRGNSGLGYGDVKMAAASGIWIGWPGVMPFFLSASLFALAAILIRPLRKRLMSDLALPFAPFLSCGLLLVLALQRRWIPVPEAMFLAVQR